jgi:small subunit ribosomal protein S1
MGVIKRVSDSDFVDAAEAASQETAERASDFGTMLEESSEPYKEGTLVIGRVVRKSGDIVVIDVGFKSEGAVPLHEFGAQGVDLVVGDEVEVLLESVEDADGSLVLSKERANKIRIWDKMAERFDADETVEGVILNKIKGGLSVDIGLKAFLPGSQVDLRPIKYLEKLIGEKFHFKIIKMNKKRGNIVLSRRVLLEEERKVSKEQALSTLQEGKVVEGIVKNITDYGAFIDLGGIDGLLHITDMSWGRVNHPSEMFAIGDTVKVMVLKFDRETERVSLGLKQTTPDPWIDAEKKYPPATRVSGRVVSIADYGAFVELQEGIEGLVHISEMTWNKNIRHPNKLVSVGDAVEAVVLSIDTEKKRISLGMKQIQENPWDRIDEKYPVGAIVEGRVRNLADFGAFVELEEGVDGLIHISDMSWTQKIKHPSEVVKKRDKIKCMVLAVDKDQERLSLGLKQLEKDPWDGVDARYPLSADIKCIVTKVTNFGAFAELEEGVEGLIHVSQLSTSRVASPRKAVRVGQEVTAKVIKVDATSRKIGLSIKAFLEGLSPEEVERELAAMEEAAALAGDDEDYGDDEGIDEDIDDTEADETVGEASAEASAEAVAEAVDEAVDEAAAEEK